MALHIEKPGIVLFVEHYDACLQFYEQQLGLARLFAHDDLVCLALGPAYLMIERGGVARPQPKTRAENPTILRFNVRDVGATANRLRAYDVDVRLERYDWGVIGVFHDPDGNRCELRDPWESATQRAQQALQTQPFSSPRPVSGRMV